MTMVGKDRMIHHQKTTKLLFKRNKDSKSMDSKHSKISVTLNKKDKIRRWKEEQMKNLK